MDNSSIGVELNLTKAAYEHLNASFSIFCDQTSKFQRNSFDLYDILRVFNLLGEEPDIEEIEDIFGEVDTHEIGYISFFTYCHFMMGGQSPEALTNNKSETAEPKKYLDYEDSLSKLQKNFWAKRREMETAFELFDAQAKGYITKGDIRKVFCCLGENLSQEEMDAIMNEGDMTGSGTLDFHEFELLMSCPDFVCSYEDPQIDEVEDDVEMVSICDPRMSFSSTPFPCFEEITIVNFRDAERMSSLETLDSSWQESESRNSICTKMAMPRLWLNDDDLTSLDQRFEEASESGETTEVTVALFKHSRQASLEFNNNANLLSTEVFS